MYGDIDLGSPSQLFVVHIPAVGSWGSATHPTNDGWGGYAYRSEERSHRNPDASGELSCHHLCINSYDSGFCVWEAIGEGLRQRRRN